MSRMAEASMAAFGAAVGVMIAMAVVVFGLRGKGNSRAPDASNIGIFHHFLIFLLVVDILNFYGIC